MPPCGLPQATPTSVVQRATAHRDFLKRHVKELRRALDGVESEWSAPVQQASLAPATTSVVSVAKKKTYVVKVKATDSNSGVAKVQVTANKKRPGALLTYKRKLRVRSAKRPKFVRAQDRAGNFSRWKKLR